MANQSPWLVASLEGNFSLADAFWSTPIAALSGDEARLSIESRLSASTRFLTGDGISITDADMERAEALAYQLWRTVWESAKAIVGATSGQDYEELLRSALLLSRFT